MRFSFPCFRTTGSPQAKSPAGSSQGAIPPEARTPTTPANKALQNVKGDHPSVSQDVSMISVSTSTFSEIQLKMSISQIEMQHFPDFLYTYRFCSVDFNNNMVIFS